MKYSFLNDYSEGAHPHVTAALGAEMPQDAGYGLDQLTAETIELLRDRISCPTADIHFATGGTQANLIVLAALLKPYEAVIAADFAHIAVHEAGAIEATGHKIIAMTADDGKLTADHLQRAVDQHNNEHWVKPAAVFISNATELGTVYTSRDLASLRECCQKLGLKLFLDGARLGTAICGGAASLADAARLTDVFTIGGTKNGAWLGEAIVLNDAATKDEFRRHLKQRGALIAKGRAVSAQFKALFENGLWFELAQHAYDAAQLLADGLHKLGFELLAAPQSNMVFPILEDALIERLQADYCFYGAFRKTDAGLTAARLVTSWATPPGAVEEFLADAAARR